MEAKKTRGNNSKLKYTRLQRDKNKSFQQQQHVRNEIENIRSDKYKRGNTDKIRIDNTP